MLWMMKRYRFRGGVVLVTLKKLSEKVGVSESYLKKLKVTEFEDGKHYFKKCGKIYFDEVAFTNWIKEDYGKSIQPTRQDLGKLLHKLKASA